METIDERALTNQAPLPNQRDCGGRLEARPISQPRCQRMITEGTLGFFASVPLIMRDRHGCGARRCISRAIGAAIHKRIRPAASRAQTLGAKLPARRGGSNDKPLNISKTAVGLVA